MSAPNRRFRSPRVRGPSASPSKTADERTEYTRNVKTAPPGGSTVASGEQETLAEIPTTPVAPQTDPTVKRTPRRRKSPPALAPPAPAKYSKAIVTVASLIGALGIFGAIYRFGRLEERISYLHSQVSETQGTMKEHNNRTLSDLASIHDRGRDFSERLARLEESTKSDQADLSTITRQLQELRRDLRDSDAKDEHERKGLFDKIDARLRILEQRVLTPSNNALTPVVGQRSLRGRLNGSVWQGAPSRRDKRALNGALWSIVADA